MCLCATVCETLYCTNSHELPGAFKLSRISGNKVFEFELDGIIKQMGSVRGRFHDRYSTEYLSCNWSRICLIVGIKSVLVRAARLYCQAGINHCLGQCWPSFYVTIWHQCVEWFAIHHIESLLIMVMPRVFSIGGYCVFCIVFCFFS